MKAFQITTSIKRLAHPIVFVCLVLLCSCREKKGAIVHSRSEQVQGIDVSHHNGTIDWKTVATKDGMEFVFIKATEGATITDGMFAKNLSGAKAAGLAVGAYHFLTTSTDAESQFQNFRNLVKKEDIDLIPVLDAERMTKGHPMTTTDYVRHVRKWVDLCKDYYGISPILYCSQGHYREYFKGQFEDCMFWCGDVDASRAFVDGESWIIWQKSIRKLHGSSSRLDVNVIAPDRSLQDIKLRRTNPVNGIDVSHHQGDIDWGEVKKHNPDLEFVYVKSTEGTTLVDPTFVANAKGAAAQGFKVGAFHYFRMTSSPRNQFQSFKKQMDKVKLDLIPMVDVETSDGKSREEVQKNLRILLNLLEKEYGKKPMLYGTNRSYNELCAPEFNDYPMYIGRYGKNRPVVTGPSHYTIWQYTDKGSLPGISKPVDLCRFHEDCSIKDISL